MRQKTTITYLEHNMLACNRINRAIASWKKHVRVFSETCTSFSENTYTFLPGHTTEDKNKYRNRQ